MQKDVTPESPEFTGNIVDQIKIKNISKDIPDAKPEEPHYDDLE